MPCPSTATNPPQGFKGSSTTCAVSSSSSGQPILLLASLTCRTHALFPLLLPGLSSSSAPLPYPLELFNYLAGTSHSCTLSTSANPPPLKPAHSCMLSMLINPASFLYNSSTLPLHSQRRFTKRNSFLTDMISYNKVTHLVDEGKVVDVVFLGFS